MIHSVGLNEYFEYHNEIYLTEPECAVLLDSYVWSECGRAGFCLHGKCEVQRKRGKS